MTPKQRAALRAKKAREKKRLQSQARRARERLRKEKRRAKRAARAAPRNRLARWSLRVRAVGKCAVCGSTKTLNAHHLLPKERYQEFKFKQINGLCLCSGHHRFGKFSAHRNPIWFVLWLKENRLRQYQWCVENVGTHETIQTPPVQAPSPLADAGGA